jgi:hypothetical protein
VHEQNGWTLPPVLWYNEKRNSRPQHIFQNVKKGIKDMVIKIANKMEKGLNTLIHGISTLLMALLFMIFFTGIGALGLVFYGFYGFCGRCCDGKP